MNKIIMVLLLAGILFLVDLYAFQGIRTLIRNISPNYRKAIYYSYWTLSTMVLSGLFIYHFVDSKITGKSFRTWLMVFVFVVSLPKLLAGIVILVDDIGRFFRWLYDLLSPVVEETKTESKTIPRSEFLAKTSIIAMGLPLAAMTYGIVSGAHDYRVRRQKLFLPNLPKSFDGIRIAQVSDIHSGSFFNKIAVQGGVDMLLAEKPDLIFFTGDLVNNRSSEVNDYIDIFGKLKAPLGVYSVTGNHDYGDYVSWDSQKAKMQNFEDLKKAHKLLGWDLLMNENRILEQSGDKIAIIGIENWGAKARFPKYGKMDLAYQGTEEAAVKILLSHDPSHWDAEVIPKYKDIDLMLAGHTHGMQFGIEIAGIKWSPIQYMYKQWAGMYQNGNQHLYVNRGYGYLGFPGRVGILPEITIIELKTA